MLDVVLEDIRSESRFIRLCVSILVVLDVVLEVHNPFYTKGTTHCFNPCCAGCSSGSGSKSIGRYKGINVSILVVLDVVLEAPEAMEAT